MMAFLDILMRKVPIAGLEIRDDALRIAFLTLDKKTQETHIRSAYEEPLPRGIIIDGVLQNAEGFAVALKKLKRQLPSGVHHIILSLPADQVFSHVYTFPPTIRGKKLQETMRLTTGFQLPQKPDELFLDWQHLGQEQEHTAVFLATIKRTIVEPYLQALKSAKLHVTAIEFHPLSYARAIAVSEDKSVMLLEESTNGTTVTILKNRAVHFVRHLPAHFIADTQAKQRELNRIADYYGIEFNDSIDERLSLDKAPLRGEPGKHDRIKDDPARWATSIGAAIRGLLPRADDTLISLMAVGTERAYSYQRVRTFAGLYANLIVGISAFFAVVFFSAWIFFVSLEADSVRRLEIIAALPVTLQNSQIIDELSDINNRIAAIDAIINTTTRWSPVLTEIASLSTTEVTITNFSLTSPSGTFVITGIGDTRIAITTFKDGIEASDLFTNATSPITNLGTRTNIPFTVSFNLADVSKAQF